MEEELKQYSAEIHQRAVKNFERRSVKAVAPDEIWGADLVDMSNIKNKNKRITFLLNIVDIYSRYAYSVPLKDKTGESVLEAFKTIGKTPQYLWVDEGKEFYNKNFMAWCDKHSIIMYHTFTGLKSVFVERFNRTMKEAFYKRFNSKLNTTYTTFLPIFIKEYNDTIHTSTDETPDNLYLHGKVSTEQLHVSMKDKVKFKIGDYVRIVRVKDIFEKGYLPKWSKEVFKITKIDTNTNPVLYEVIDLLGEEVLGKLYEQQLILTKIPFFKVIDKKMKTKTDNRKKYVLVSYDGYPKKFDEWITETEYKKFLKFKKDLV